MMNSPRASLNSTKKLLRFGASFLILESRWGIIVSDTRPSLLVCSSVHSQRALTLAATAKVALKSTCLFKLNRAHPLGSRIKLRFASIARSLTESSDEEVSTVEPIKNACSNVDVSTRFSIAVANLFRSSRVCDTEKKISSMVPERDDEMNLFSQVLDDEKKLHRVELGRNDWDDQMDFVGDSYICVPNLVPNLRFWRHPAAYNKMMKALTQAGKVNEVVRLLREMLWSECEPNVLCYNTVMNALAVANRPKEAKAVFKEMIALGLVPNVSSYNVLVKSCCRMEQLDLVYNVIEGMIKWGCKPDSTTYSTLIAGLCWVGRLKEAEEVLNYMLKEGCPPTAHSYTPIVHGYCMEGKIQDAEILMAIMESEGFPPSTVTYNVLIDGLCKIGDFDAVAKIIRESQSKGWKPNVDTYNTYMNGICKAGKLKEAIGLFEAMQENGFVPTSVSLSIYVDCLCRDSKICEAICLLDMSSEMKWSVGVVCYNAMMSRLSEIASWLEVLNLFTNMLKKGITPNTRTLNIVINSLCKDGKLWKAKCIFKSGRFIANIVTYNCLIHWCFQCGETDEAQILFSRMNAKKIDPDTITYTTMFVGLCKAQKYSEAIKCFLRYLQGKFDPDVATGLIIELHKWRRFKELQDLYEVAKTLYIESQSYEIYKICCQLSKMLGKK